ncbi:MAG: hypothetical protein LBI33_08410 [Propionibacteriaceae bacterium]|jgi:hypothetical protein|nr:hypothetical protein [Propionibacteriaceae bacterium]
MARDHALLNRWAVAHTALLVEGQSRLMDLIGTADPLCELDAATGLMTLAGHRLQFALLGSVDDASGTWRWAWADPDQDEHALAVRRTLSLRGFGRETGLWEFDEATFSTAGITDLGMTPGATVAIVASPQLLGGAIFSLAGPAGRTYTVLTDARLTMEAPTAFTAADLLTRALAYGADGHRDIVTVYAGAHQLPLAGQGDRLTLVFEDETALDLTLSDDRVTTMVARH